MCCVRRVREGESLIMIIVYLIEDVRFFIFFVVEFCCFHVVMFVWSGCTYILVFVVMMVELVVEGIGGEIDGGNGGSGG